ncbi:MAG TPA: zf-HC2 domain-containing protein [Streptosporangiaceae bacterium]|nr:zf-HC2 domain-containing protein [Streptosporangiaceae bacterium]
MSHLGRRLSALIDGELGDAERDQAHAHLVSCEACRAEAAALRTLKRRVHNLGETSADSALTRRLIALEDLVQATQPPAATRARSAFSAFSAVATRPPAWDSVYDWPGEPAAMTASPLGGSPAAAGRGRGHTRYVVAGAVAALAVGLGAASFAAGGGGRMPGPTVTPEVDVYNAQHAEMTGELPVLLPGAGTRARPSPAPHRTGQTLLTQP